MNNHYPKPTIPETTKQVISIHIIVQFYIRPPFSNSLLENRRKEKSTWRQKHGPEDLWPKKEKKFNHS